MVLLSRMINLMPVKLFPLSFFPCYIQQLSMKRQTFYFIVGISGGNFFHCLVGMKSHRSDSKELLLTPPFKSIKKGSSKIINSDHESGLLDKTREKVYHYSHDEFDHLHWS